MSINAVCPGCNYAVNVPDEYLGRKAKCAKCRAVFTVGDSPQVLLNSTEDSSVATKVSPSNSVANPQPRTSTAKTKTPNPLHLHGQIVLCPTLKTQDQYNRFRQSILDPLKEPIEMEDVSTGYKLALGFLAVILILLFCTYLGMIIGLCFFEYYYFATTFEPFLKSLNPTEGSGQAKATILLIAAYIAVPVGLALVIVVLVKPLFFGWKSKDTRFEIFRKKEPLFFEFVDSLCRCVGAPAPERIFVDCEVNAAAGLTQGFFGALFGGNRCDLIIGLPLVAGMKTSEVAGVLAHEFGHFTQSGARRVHYIVQTILGWFAHIYYYRDRMDSWVVAGSTSGHYVNIVFCWIIRVFLWAARRLIWVFLLLGHMTAGFMSRQMEYDADAFETKLTGSKGFAESTQKLLTLTFANRKTVDDINTMIRENRLPDNYPLLIAANMEIMGDECKTYVIKIIEESKTGSFDTHPCDKDRIAAAERADQPGIFHCDEPASLLFRNFLELSREVSIDFYRSIVDWNWEPESLKESREIIDQLRSKGEFQKAAWHFFLDAYLPYCYLPVNNVVPSKTAKESAQRIKTARELLLQMWKKTHEAIDLFIDAETDQIRGEYCRELIRVGISLKEMDKELRFRSVAEAEQAIQKHIQIYNRNREQVAQRDAVEAERLCCVRELLANKEIQNRIEQGDELHRRMETLFPILKKLAELQEVIGPERRRFLMLDSLFSLFPHLQSNLANSIMENIASVLDQSINAIQRIKREFGELPYPFDDEPGIKLREYLVSSENEKLLESDLYNLSVSGTLIERLGAVHVRILGEACAMALAVETALGLPAIESPENI